MRNSKIYRIVNLIFVLLILATIYLSSIHSWVGVICLWAGFFVGLVIAELIRNLEEKK